MSIELTSENVENLLKDCLIENDEDFSSAIEVEGIVNNYKFSSWKLLSHKEEIKELISQLPDEFLEGGGGGWSFLNLCMRQDGVQWTGLHWVQEMLYVMAAGLGLANFQLPRYMWSALPGSVPYIVFRTEERSDKVKELENPAK